MKKSQKSSPPISLSDHLTKAVRARWAKTGKEERSAYARKIAKARWDRIKQDQK